MIGDRVPDEARRRALIQPVMDAARAGDTPTAKRLAAEALAAGVEHPLLLNLRALEHEEQGRFALALADLRRAQALAPGDFSILNACGLCLGRMGRFDEAMQCFEEALALRPDFGPAWFNSGWTLEQLGETVKAVQAYEKAVEFGPKNTQAWANLAWLAARRGDADATRAYVAKAHALQPDHPTATLALAAVELAEPLVAEQRLRGLLARPDLGAFDRGIAFGQLGDVLDAQDRPAEAFAAYASGNQVFRAEAAPRFEGIGQATLAATLGWLVPWAEHLDREHWTARTAAAPSQTGEREHVFLLGFPRSGTTLMESVLAAHPDVVSLEERNTLDAGLRAFMGDARGMARLAGAHSHDLQPHRDDYWKIVRGHGVEPAGKVFIDKNPLSTLKLPLIYKLFPHAKIIFALRDPRDVVLSCFRRRFNLNASTFELLDITRAAAFYDLTMRFWEAIRLKQDLDERGLVYEQLVEDFETQARATCEFIGADWRPELADFAGRGRRGEVASASAAQISRGLFSDGAGQWRRYRRELAPVLPILAPWVERFGYPAA